MPSERRRHWIDPSAAGIVLAALGIDDLSDTLRDPNLEAILRSRLTETAK